MLKTEAEKKDTNSESQKSGFEVTDANVRILLISAALLVLFGVILQWGLGVGFVRLKSASVVDLNGSLSEPPEDFLSGAAPEKQVSVYREETGRVLSTYGWVDRNRQIVRVPIGVAMERLSHGK